MQPEKDRSVQLTPGTDRHHVTSKNSYRQENIVLLITPFQRTALQMLAEGRSNCDIARRLCVTERELDSLLATLYERMGLTNQVDAIADAVRRGLVWMPSPPALANDGRSDGG